MKPLISYLLRQAKYRQSFPNTFFALDTAKKLDPKLGALIQACQEAERALDEYVLSLAERV